ncbi:CapA family protein, partial [Chloroflexota bacterium]
LDRVLPIFEEHDLRFCNLEGPVSDRGTPVSKPILIRSKVETIAALKKARFDVVSFANNHSLDYGPDAFLHTLKLLDQNSIAFVGGGKDLLSAQKPVFLERKGYRIGFLAYASYFDKGFEATEQHPGLSPVRVDPLYAPPHINEEDLKAMIAAISETKAQADIVVVSHHWGVSLGRTLTVYQRYLAHQTIDAGADIVLGSHPHILQGIELYKNKVICYSLGNFVFGTWPQFFTNATKQTMILTCLMEAHTVKEVFFRPVIANELFQPEIVTAGEQMFEMIVDTMSELSAPLGTLLYPQGDKIWVLNKTSGGI